VRDVGTDEHVRRQALGFGDQLVLRADDAAGEIARRIDEA
jgi:hypothetical protein